jgi:Protein of unknown function (DUF2892)
MKPNEGTVDRILRALLGVALLAAGYFMATGTVAIVLYVVGVIVLFTAATGFCLLYKLIGVSTLKK